MKGTDFGSIDASHHSNLIKRNRTSPAEQNGRKQTFRIRTSMCKTWKTRHRSPLKLIIDLTDRQ
jgi:hypothetical protein